MRSIPVILLTGMLRTNEKFDPYEGELLVT